MRSASLSIRALALLMALGLALGIGTAVPAQEQKPIRVLFVLGSPPFHDIVNLPPILERVMRQVGGFQVTRLAPPADRPADGAHLARLAELSRRDYDVALFYTTGYQLNPEQERALQTFVEEGGGLVPLHGASASFGNSQTWLRLLGGRFAGHAPGTFNLPVQVVDRTHPVTKGVPDFHCIDEEYCHVFPEGSRRYVLARFAERPAGTKVTNGNNDIVWVQEVGRGRVFYCGLGHGKEAWGNPAWQKLVLQGICWAAGRPREIRVPVE